MQKEKYLETCLALTTGLLVFWFIYGLKILLIIALCVGIIGMFFPNTAKLLTGTWNKFGEIMGGFVSKILLAIIFFLFMSPIAWLYHLFNKNGSFKKGSKSVPSYWITRNHTFLREDLDRMW